MSTEVAFTKTNGRYPLCIVVVLRVINGPEVSALRDGLTRLQERHLMLNVEIEKRRGTYWFVKMRRRRLIQLDIVERKDDLSWRQETERSLNESYSMRGPLLRVVYLPPSLPGAEAEIILVLHHGFVDSCSLRLLIHELLSLCGRQVLPASKHSTTQEPDGALLEPRFTSDFRGWRLWRRLFSFFGRQLRSEYLFQRKGVGLPIPGDSYNAVTGLSLSLDQSRKLIAALGRLGVSLNSVLSAAMLLAVVRNCHGARKEGLFRSIAFADIRDYLEEMPAESDFGSYISMLRFTLPVSTEWDLLSVARELMRQMQAAGRRGELQLFSLLSKYLVTVAMHFEQMRLGNTALSFIGKLDLQPNYGPIQLEGVQAFITNNRLGPEFSGFGKILFGRIELDFTYMPAEMDAPVARAIVRDIETLLKEIT
jgi:hypothetical protein